MFADAKICHGLGLVLTIPIYLFAYIGIYIGEAGYFRDDFTTCLGIAFLTMVAGAVVGFKRPGTGGILVIAGFLSWLSLGIWANGWPRDEVFKVLGFYGIFMLSGIFFLASWALERAAHKASCPDALILSRKDSKENS